MHLEGALGLDTKPQAERLLCREGEKEQGKEREREGKRGETGLK